MYWYATRDKKSGNTKIRRFYQGKQFRYPAKEYLKLSSEEIEALLLRLNLPLKQLAEKEEIVFNNAFFIKEGLEEHLKSTCRKSRKSDRWEIKLNILNTYFFPFFLTRNCRTREDFITLKNNWIDWLVEEKKLAVGTIKQVFQVVNRYLKFNGETLKIEFYQFDTREIPTQRIKAKRINVQSKRIYVSEETFFELLKVADKRIHPHLKLAYYYGLRLGETIPLTVESIYEDHIHIFEAVTQDGMTDVPKDAEIRDIPHFWTTAEACYEIICSKIHLNRTTISKLCAAAVEELFRTKKIHRHFDFHALRGSFCTNTMNSTSNLNISFNEVREYMGHAHLNTTMKYLYKSKSFSSKKFCPKK